MISKLESTGNSVSAPQASMAELERNLGSLSLQYMRQTVELPLNHEKQAVLARLYSAANTLHQAVRNGTVENAIFEISSNLIACEEVALLGYVQAAKPRRFHWFCRIQPNKAGYAQAKCKTNHRRSSSGFNLD